MFALVEVVRLLYLAVCWETSVNGTHVFTVPAPGVAW